MIEDPKPRGCSGPIDPKKGVEPVDPVNPADHPDKLGHPTRDVQHGGDRQRLRQAILEGLVAILNEALAMDPGAIRELLQNRVVCNKTFLKHPSIHVLRYEDGTCALSPLDLLNGLFGVVPDGPLKGRGWIAAEAAEDGVIFHFAVTDPGRHRVAEKEN